MTRQLNKDNGLQARWTERQHLTAVWRNGGFSASYDSFVGKQKLVLRINICGENPPLRQYAARYLQADLNSRTKLKLRENKQQRMKLLLFFCQHTI